MLSFEQVFCFSNFSQYKYRFTMPKNGDGENLWYSYNFGLAHIISFSTEVYFWWQFGFAQIVNQYSWLEQDLIWATAPENRTKYPWIITMGHQPMYCSNANQDDCTNYDSRPRSGLPYIHTYGLEKLFYDYGVDLELWAHEHSYERLDDKPKETYLNRKLYFVDFGQFIIGLYIMVHWKNRIKIQVHQHI